MNPASTAPSTGQSPRRKFLQQTAVATAAIAGSRYLRFTSASAADAVPTSGSAANSATQPWFLRATRWMQTNIAELDATRYDIPWWRTQWARTKTQGIVVNAGGIVAFYPTQIPFHPKAQFLGDRDLFGDLLKAAHADGIAVFARMDSNGAPEETLLAHPEWFTVSGVNGRPFADRGLSIPCINGGYYREHIPAILTEIAAKYKPEGFTDNIWSGLPRANICYCDNCALKFHADRALDLPQQANWDDRAYRAWIEWGYACRLEIWDLFNKTTRTAGGKDCLWVGMNGVSISGAAGEFRDYREICKRTEILMIDNQRRVDTTGFQSNGVGGRLVHGVLGWDKLAPESMALYQTATENFRVASKPDPEVRLWALDGIAAGIQPWWHYINAYQEDRRMYETPVPLGQWHQQHEEFLVRRTPVATVGIVYSQRNNDFFGRQDVENQVNLPQRGFTEALLHARIPYVLVHADDLDRDAAQLKLLILPNLGTMTDAHLASVRKFAQNGGGLIASGATSLCDQWGDPRADLALGDLFGVHLPLNHFLRSEAGRRQFAGQSSQTYLRLTPELRAQVDGPHPAGEPPAVGTRHEVLRGFEHTDIIPYGGNLGELTLDATAQNLLTLVPNRPTAPPEMIWTQNDHTNLPGLILNERPGFGRAVYLAADLDRRYARDNIEDSEHLLINLVRWAVKDDVPLKVDGPGLIDSHLYQQPGRALVHLVNLSNTNAWRGPVEELIPVGPLKISVRLPVGITGKNLRLLVSEQKPTLSLANGWTSFELPTILDHELAVIE